MDIMSALMPTIERFIQREFRIEYGTVVQHDTEGLNLCGVQCRDDPNAPSSEDYWNTVTVKVRSVKNDGNPGKIMHHYCTVLQDYSQKWAGHPYTPRIGDMVAVLFLFNQKPLVLGTVYTDTQDPVCRAPFNPKSWTAIDARYDDVKKWCQWEMPTFDINQEVVVQTPGKHPICTKTFHKNRDQIYATDCKEGNSSACKCCTMLDHIKRCSNQWEKIYSQDTCSCDPEHPYLPHCNEKTKKRHEWHEPCGSYFVFQNKPCGGKCTTCSGCGTTECQTCGGLGMVVDQYDVYIECSACSGTGRINCSSCGGVGSTTGSGTGSGSCDLDYGSGLVRLENATAECAMKGHLNMGPRGTIDVHTKHCNTPYADEDEGTRMSVVAREDNTVDHSFEAIDFDVNSYIEILKNGDINISSLNNSAYIEVVGANSTIDTHGETLLRDFAGDKIEWHTPLCHDFGDMHIDGTCTHYNCSCGSDRRIKNDIKILDMGLDEILKLDPVSFLWKKQNDNNRHFGLIAQDVEKVIPEVIVKTNIVSEDTPDGQLAINYEQIIPVLINAIKEQNTKIDMLERELTGLKERLNDNSL